MKKIQQFLIGPDFKLQITVQLDHYELCLSQTKGNIFFLYFMQGTMKLPQYLLHLDNIMMNM